MRLVEDAEAQAMERLKRALAHDKAKSRDFLSLRPTSRVICGLNAVLCAVQKDKAKLVILPASSPAPIFDLVLELCALRACPVWTPLTSGVGLGRIIGLKPSPCLAAAFIGEGDSADAITSIREFVLKNLQSDAKEDVQNALRKRLKQ